MLQTMGFQVFEPDSKGFCGFDDRCGIEFWQRDRRMIPYHVAASFDAGLVGKDLLINSGVRDLSTVCELCYAKRTNRPTRWVLTSDDPSKLSHSGVRIGCELTEFADQLLRKQPQIKDYALVKLEGNEEMAISDGLCDAVVCVTETGSALREAGLKVIRDDLFVSTPQIVARSDLSAEGTEALDAVATCLNAVVGAQSRVMVKFDIPSESLEDLDLPSAVAPTVAHLSRGDWLAVEICVQRMELPSVLPEIAKSGGRAIAVQNVQAYLHVKED